jgi:hypothetical protein
MGDLHDKESVKAIWETNTEVNEPFIDHWAIIAPNVIVDKHTAYELNQEEEPKYFLEMMLLAKYDVLKDHEDGDEKVKI